MRNSIVIGSVLALVGLASVAQASDWSKLSGRDATRVNREVSDDGRGDRHDRYERREQSHERRDQSGERRRESHEMHDESDHSQDRR